MNNILMIETATDSCSVILYANHQLYQRINTVTRQHATSILPFVDELLKEAQLSVKELEAIAVSVGPGSFVGARLGVSVAQGLAFPHHIPLIPLSTLAVLAQSAYEQYHVDHILVAVDAKMREVYWGLYQVNSNGIMSPLQPDQIGLPDQVNQPEENWLGVGSAWTVYESILPTSCAVAPAVSISPQAMLDLTLASTKTMTALELQPVYLRTSAAWVSA